MRIMSAIRVIIVAAFLSTLLLSKAYSFDTTARAAYVLDQSSGTGIEHCEDLDQDLTSVCENDPRTTWRSNLIHVDFSGNLIWQRASSFVFEGEEDEALPSTASEWVFKTKSGNIASVVDLSFGVGLEILK